LKFRKKPVVIDAIQWTGNNLQECMIFCQGNSTYELMASGNCELVIATLEDGQGEIKARNIASKMDYIIRGVQGEYYPCKPDIFDAIYEEEFEFDINYMVNRFLGWQLPKDLSPDAGIKFNPSELQKSGQHPWPSGTNFLNAEQARNMINILFMKNKFN
jgi:hypothetical protein